MSVLSTPAAVAGEAADLADALGLVSALSPGVVTSEPPDAADLANADLHGLSLFLTVSLRPSAPSSQGQADPFGCG